MVSDKSDRYKISCDYFEKWVYDTVSVWAGLELEGGERESLKAKGGLLL